jgi:2-polyprenyl-3-methyl-5-hydroxy-6-metoxy-1,4-benzoquinol methylase
MNQPAHRTIRTEPRSRCYLCDTAGTLLYSNMADRLFGAPGLWNLRQCENPDCALAWLDPMPLEEDIGKAYETYYTHGAIDRGSRWNGLVWGASYFVVKPTKLYEERKRINLMYLDAHAPGRLLEIGCGDGSRLALFRTRGWAVEGQDVDPKAVAAARATHGIPVHLGTLEEVAFPDDAFDAVIASHVIEHVHDPVRLLKECRRILKPGAPLVLATPNFSSYGHEQFGIHWFALDPPRHLHLFGCKSLRQAITRAEFRACSVWTTTARAQINAAGSFDIARTGRHVMGPYASVARTVAAFAFQLKETARHRQDPLCGDECVALATK